MFLVFFDLGVGFLGFFSRVGFFRLGEDKDEDGSGGFVGR